MKILLVQKMAGISGSERYLLGILPELRRRGLDASFLVVQHPGNADKNRAFIAELNAASVPVHTIDSRLPLSPSLIWKMAALIRRERIDVLHTNLIHADVWGALVKSLFFRGLQLVSVKHGYSESYQATHGLDPRFVRTDRMSVLTRWAGRYADRVICISRALETFLNESGLVPTGKTSTIPYGFDFSRVPSTALPGTLRFGSPQIVVPGRVVPVKQHHLLIEILPELVAAFPKLSVVMVGGGPLLDDLRARTESMGVGGHVRWEGFRPNMHDYLRDSDVAVIPSAAEGFGLVVLEAWYHGKPVVAFDVPALNEVIEHGTDGELVPAFDTLGLLDTLRALLSSPQRQEAMGQAGKRKQVDVYGLDTMTVRTIAAIRAQAGSVVAVPAES